MCREISIKSAFCIATCENYLLASILKNLLDTCQQDWKVTFLCFEKFKLFDLVELLGIHDEKMILLK